MRHLSLGVVFLNATSHQLCGNVPIFQSLKPSQMRYSKPLHKMGEMGAISRRGDAMLDTKWAHSPFFTK
jgi:hypothetical protein